MKIGFVVNKVATERTNYSTTHMALTAHIRGHQVYYIEVADFTLGSDEMVHAYAHKPPPRKFRTASTFFKAMQSQEALRERISVEMLDVFQGHLREIVTNYPVAQTELARLVSNWTGAEGRPGLAPPALPKPSSPPLRCSPG